MSWCCSDIQVRKRQKVDSVHLNVTKSKLKEWLSRVNKCLSQWKRPDEQSRLPGRRPARFQSQLCDSLNKGYTELLRPAVEQSGITEKSSLCLSLLYANIKSLFVQVFKTRITNSFKDIKILPRGFGVKTFLKHLIFILWVSKHLKILRLCRDVHTITRRKLWVIWREAESTCTTFIYLLK